MGLEVFTLTEAEDEGVGHVFFWISVSRSSEPQKTVGQGNGDAVHVRSSHDYPLVNQHSDGKWPFVVSFPTKHGDFP